MKGCVVATGGLTVENGNFVGPPIVGLNVGVSVGLNVGFNVGASVGFNVPVGTP